MPTEIVLKKFNPRTMDDARRCIFVGKTNTGKSVLCADILYHKRHIEDGIVMSATEAVNHYWSQFVPDTFIFNSFDLSRVVQLLNRQLKRLEKLPRGSTPPVTFLILDDCMYDKKIMKSDVMRFLFMNGRHLGIFLCVTLQYVMDILPDIRTNVDYVFVLRENSIQNRVKLYNTFFGAFPTYDDFSRAMDACTEEFGCLVISNVSRSNKLDEFVYWYRAKERKHFTVGSEAFTKFHYYNYNKKNTIQELFQNLQMTTGGGSRSKSDKATTTIVKAR